MGLSSILCLNETMVQRNSNTGRVDSEDTPGQLTLAIADKNTLNHITRALLSCRTKLLVTRVQAIKVSDNILAKYLRSPFRHIRTRSFEMTVVL